MFQDLTASSDVRILYMTFHMHSFILINYYFYPKNLAIFVCTRATTKYSELHNYYSSQTTKLSSADRSQLWMFKLCTIVCLLSLLTTRCGLEGE